MGPQTGKTRFSSREEGGLCGAARTVWFIMANAEHGTDWGVSEIVSLGNNGMKKISGVGM